MLEILLVAYLSKQIGNLVESSGLPRKRFQLLLIALWIVGEFCGAALGAIITGSSETTPALYAFALLGAGVGAGIAFLIANKRI